MLFNLPALARAKGIRRKEITFRPVQPSAALATDLAAIYAPAWQVWRDAKARIMASYDAQPLTDGLTLDTAAQTGAEIQSAASEFLTRLVTVIGPGLQRWVTRAEKIHRDRWSSVVNAGAGIDLSMILTGGEVQETLSAFLERNAALVRNVSEQAQGRISDAVFRGYQNRTPARQVAKEIDDAIGLGRKRSLAIAADQNSKLSGALDDERMAEAGLDLWKYRHSGKAHPRSSHKARDGRIYTLRGNNQVNPDGSTMAGGDVIEPGDAPTQPPWCACRKQAYISLMAELD